jgi:hypothetical protein
MGRAREAAIHRELARLHAELADALDEDTPANDTEGRPHRRKPRSTPLVKPTGKVKPSDLDMARADALLKRHYGR